MEKILSQDEVDALLKGLCDGDIETTKESASAQENVRSFDLANQDRIVRGRMPTLDIINDRFAKTHRISLSGSLRRMVDINVCQAEMIKFGEFIRTLPVPTSLHILKMEPLRGHVLFMIESRLIFNLVDCFFGGSGKGSYKIEGRDFTSIEYRVINKVVKQVLRGSRAGLAADYGRFVQFRQVGGESPVCNDYPSDRRRDSGSIRTRNGPHDGKNGPRAPVLHHRTDQVQALRELPERPT